VTIEQIPTLSVDDVAVTLTELLATLLAVPAASVPAEATLDSLEIDSIVIVELVLAIQTALGVRVELGVITPDDSVATAAGHVHALLAAPAAATTSTQEH
jgi:acyl carrier protein